MNQKLITQFKYAAASGQLDEILEEHSTFNIENGTLGGRFFWNTYTSNGWKLQVNVISGWWRILDANNVRVARGTKEEQLQSLLERRPISVFCNYMDKGFNFVRTSSGRRTGRTVVLIHGWGVRARSMQKLANCLAHEGYEAYSYDYPTSACSLAEHCRIFLGKFRELLRTLPEDETLFFLTHSMGGLVLRGAMAEMTEEECRRIHAIVMLGPPNRGSILAYLGKMPIVRNFNASLKDMSPDEDSFVSNIPEPAWLPPVGIIAGRYDGKVALEDTSLPEPLPYKRVVVDSTHPGLREPSKVMKHILFFLNPGS